MHSRSDPPAERGTEWQPACSIEPNRGGYTVRFELDGIRPADIELRHSHGRLCASGVRRHLRSDQATPRETEVVWRRFESCVRLPVAFEDCTMSCDFRNGALVVTLMRKEPDAGAGGAP